MKIADLEPNEKPREKIRMYGPKALSNAELLAIILRTGDRENSVLDLSRKILRQYSDLQNLTNAELEELTALDGLGPAKASAVLALCEISKRINLPTATLDTKIRSPKDVFSLMRRELCFDRTEKLYLLSINSRGKCIAKDMITSGTINETIINSREIFQKAFSRNAQSVILVHNHPSGETTPSTEDIKATKAVSEAGNKIGIPLLDHIIIANGSFVSLKQLGLLDCKQEGGDKN